MKQKEIEQMERLVTRHNAACDIAIGVVRYVMPEGTQVAIVCVSNEGEPLTLSGNLSIEQLRDALARVDLEQIQNVTDGLKVS
jgi:hypothetical protein